MSLWGYLREAWRRWRAQRPLVEIRDVERVVEREVRVEVPVEVVVERVVERVVEIPCPHPGMWLRVPDALVPILPRVKEITSEEERLDPHLQGGERKRHRVYAKLMKEFPFQTWKNLAFAIEIAMRWSPDTPDDRTYTGAP